MRIGVLANDLVYEQMRGLQRYSAGLIRALEESGECEVILFARTPLQRRFDFLSSKREIWFGTRELLWEQYELPMRARSLGVDVLHAPAERGLPALAFCPTVVTRHDEVERLFPGEVLGRRRSKFRTLYSDNITMRTATAVATISERSRRDILRFWNRSPESVTNCSEGIEDRFFEPVTSNEIERVRKRWGLTEPFILYLGGFDPRKDVATLVRAFLQLSCPGLTLALCGPPGRQSDDVRKLIEQNGGGDRVKVTGPVPDEDLPPLYAACEVLVYPSLHEGFGLQAAEGLACGAPLVVSDGGALPEIAGDSAVIFPAGDAKACAEAIRVVLARGKCDEVRLRGYAQASKFRWNEVVHRYLDLYRSLLSSR